MVLHINSHVDRQTHLTVLWVSTSVHHTYLQYQGWVRCTYMVIVTVSVRGNTSLPEFHYKRRIHSNCTAGPHLDGHVSLRGRLLTTATVKLVNIKTAKRLVELNIRLMRNTVIFFCGILNSNPDCKTNVGRTHFELLLFFNCPIATVQLIAQVNWLYDDKFHCKFRYITPISGLKQLLFVCTVVAAVKLKSHCTVRAMRPTRMFPIWETRHLYLINNSRNNITKI